MGEKILLASCSPRRRELMALITDAFAVCSPDFDESSIRKKNPEKLAQLLSGHKAKSISCKSETLVIAADTVVAAPDGSIFGKPRDAHEASAMLHALSGKKHRVITGVTLLDGKYEDTFCVVTDVYFRLLEETEIAAYISSGEPFDKAGGYGIQGKAALFVERIDGDYFNVVGFPVSSVYLAVQKWKAQAEQR